MSQASAKPAPRSEEQRQLRAFVADEVTKAVIEQAVAELMIPNAAVQRGSVEEATQALGEQRSPKILVVDISRLELPLSAMAALAEVCEPGVSVIVIGDRNDVGLFRDLTAHGVSDYIVKPVTLGLIQSALLNVLDSTGRSRQSSRLGRVVAVVGSRGGVGSTLAATGLAWTIAERRRRRVALVDLDLQLGSAALALDLEASRGLREALENPSRIDGLFVDRTMTKASDTLFVLSAEEPLDEVFTPDQAAIDALLKELRSKLHYVVVDVPRQAAQLRLQLLQASTNLIMVSDLSLAGMRDTLRSLSLMPGINAACQTTLCANRVGEHRQGEISREEFEKAVGRPIDITIPFDARVVAMAMNVGQPVALGRNKVATALEELTDRVCGVAAPARERGLAFWRPRWAA